MQPEYVVIDRADVQTSDQLTNRPPRDIRPFNLANDVEDVHRRDRRNVRCTSTLLVRNPESGCFNHKRVTRQHEVKDDIGIQQYAHYEYFSIR